MIQKLLASTALTLAVFPSAYGQTPVPPATSGKSAALEEIVVTAQHRKENVQKTAISITTISGAELARVARTDLASALQDVPSLKVQGSPQGGQIFIRGVGATGDSNWSDPDVAIYFDGVYSGRAEAALASIYDLQRLEVLRGPQGTLYGRNATGGVINILTNDPTVGYHAGVNVDIGNYNLQHYDGFVNLPLNDDLDVRMAAMRETRAGYYSNGGDAEDNNAARAKILYRPTDDLTIKAGVDELRLTGVGETTAPSESGFDGPVDPSNPWQVTEVHPPFGPVYTPFPDRVNYKFLTAYMQADWDLGWGVLTLLPSYSYSNRYDLTQLFGPPNPVGNPANLGLWNQRQYTGEARLASPATSPLKWVFGVYILDSTEIGVQTGGTTTVYTVLPATLPAKSQGAFGQLTYPITDKFRLTGGVRYTRDEKSDTSPLLLSCVPVIITNGGYRCGGTATATYQSSLSSGAFTYKAGVEYDLARRSMLYAQVASGYKAGGYDTTAYPNTSYKPETLTAFEIGSKNRFFDNTLQINAELFYYKYKDYQVQFSNNVNYEATVPQADIPPADRLCGCQFQQYIENAAAGTNKGGEVEAKYQFTDNDQFDLSASYIQANYGQLEIANAPNPPFVGTGPGPNPVYLAGRPVANTPKWSGTLGYQHTFDIFNGELLLRVESKLSTGYWASIQEWYPGTYQPGFTRTNLLLNYSPESGRWTIGLWAKNVENGAQKTTVFPFYRAEYSDPQTFGANLSYRF